MRALPGLVRELGFDCYVYLNVQPVRTYAVSNYPRRMAGPIPRSRL